jgi:GTPase SAR1 family protein
MDVPVILVANKIDQLNDRMVTKEEGQKRGQEIGCACFHEISARESIDEVHSVFRDACRFWRFFCKFPKLKRSKSDSIRLSMTIHSDVEMILSPDKILSLCYDNDEKRRPVLLFRRTRSTWNEDSEEQDEFDELEGTVGAPNEPFRSRAKTDGNLMLSSRARKWKLASSLVSPPQSHSNYRLVSRRNSISLRGTYAMGHVSY